MAGAAANPATTVVVGAVFNRGRKGKTRAISGLIGRVTRCQVAVCAEIAIRRRRLGPNSSEI